MTDISLERRAVRGVSVLVVRTLGLQAVTFGATIVIARLLSPSDYGIFALALAIQQIARSMIELGLPVPLVQRDTPPTVAEQRTVTGVVFAAGAAFFAIVTAVAFVALPLLSIDSAVMRSAAVASAAVPLYALRLVPMILIERDLQFNRLIAVEISETLAFYAFALPAAALDLGAYSLAGGIPVAALIGVIVATCLKPWSFGLRLDFAVIRPLAAFGLRVATLYPLQLVRELGVVGIGSIAGGPAAVGFYAFSLRLFALHTALTTSIQRVGLPVLARATDRSGLAAQATAVSAVAAGLVTAVVAGATDPLVACLFGSKWSPVADVVLVLAPGFLVAASAGAVMSSLALASRNAAAPIHAAIAAAAVSTTLAAATVPWLGARGAGVATAAGLIVLAVWLAVSLPGAAGALKPVAKAVVIAAVAAVSARGLVTGTDLVALLSAAGIAGAVWLALTCLLMRGELRLGVRLVARNL